MRNLKRNQQKVYFKQLADTEEMLDDYGNLTGEQKVNYGELQSCNISVSGNKGDVNNQMFGIQLDYDRTMCTADMNCEICETSVLWVDETDTDKPHDYIVKRKSRTLNQIVYAIKRVDVSE